MQQGASHLKRERSVKFTVSWYRDIVKSHLKIEEIDRKVDIMPLIRTEGAWMESNPEKGPLFHLYTLQGDTL